MKKKLALRPIRRTSPADARCVETAIEKRRAYPDARTLAVAIRDAAARAIRVAAIPTAGILAGCTAGSGDVVDGLSPLRLPWQGRIGTVVEGLRAPEEPVPLAGAVVPVQPDPILLTPIPPPPPPDPPPLVPDPIPLGGAPMIVDPTPPEPPPSAPDPVPVQGGARPVSPSPDPPVVDGLMGMVRTRSAPTRLVHAGPVPRTLSDEALAAALASIEG